MEYLIVTVLILFSALFSGLTLGLMGLSAHELKRKMTLGDSDAARVYPVRKKGNLLLTTLLVGNVAVNAAISIFLGSIASGIVAGITATILIVVFGEIIPQAVFSRFALSLGAKVAWLVRILIFVLYPVCKPISMILDKVLGEELPAIYSKKELVKIIEEHEDDAQSEVDEDEERIIKGALTFSDKKVEDNMTPRTVVEAFEDTQVIDEDLIREIQESGFSRFPVYSEDLDEVIGILHVSELLGSSAIGKTVKNVAKKEVSYVDEKESLDDALDIFLKRRQHMCIVRDEFGGTVGVITLEDILEEIINREIVDERDNHTDMRDYARENANTSV